MTFTVASALRWWTRECPDQVVLSVDDETLTFGELHEWSGRVANDLVRQGVKPGDRVCVVALNSMNYAVLAIALIRIGAIGAPLIFRSSPREIAEGAQDIEPVLIFTDSARRAAATEALQGSTQILRSLDDVRALRQGAVWDADYEPEPDAPVFIIGTSGSTARPKGVVYTHRTIMTYASEFAIMEPRCGRGSRVLSVGPFSSASGYLLLMQFSATGATLFIESQFDAARALDLLVKHRITTFQGAPVFFERIAALKEFATADLSNLYWTQVGGARVSGPLLEAWNNKGVALRQLYGSTEAGGGWGARDDTALSAPEKCGRGGIFTRYAIRGENGGFAPPGIPGEILVRGACVMAGYWRNAEATEAALRGGWLHTGDLGVMDERGNLTFIDRLKDIIISGGLNISAAEVETVIAGVDGVDEVAVIAAKDEKFGETPLAIVHGDIARLSIASIVEHCNKQLANHKVPRYVALEPEPLPRLPSGKISKQALRSKYKDADRQLQRVR